ncbi:MAG: hypothetical protein V4707_08995 [Pseudomonadota bacterium]
MKRLILAAAFGALALGACSDPAPEPEETLEPQMEAPVAPPVEEAPPPTTAPPPPADSTTLPPESRTSEETVKPESETLFY